MKGKSFLNFIPSKTSFTIKRKSFLNKTSLITKGASFSGGVVLGGSDGSKEVPERCHEGHGKHQQWQHADGKRLPSTKKNAIF